MMKVLVTGANGQVGQEVVLLGQKKAWHVLAYSSQNLNITNAQQIADYMLKEKPDFVVNAAAYTKVDLAEDEKEQAFLVNATGVENLAKACKAQNAPLIHLSTDYIFDGKKPEAYVETDTANPQNAYGASKWAGEEVLRSIWENHIILRVSWVFGQHGNNFVKTMLKLKDKDQLKIVADQQGSPTGARHIAEVIIKIIENLDCQFGTYHYTDAPFTTWYDFAKTIFDEAKLLCHPELIAIAASEYPTKALRPLNSKLDCTKIKTTFGISQRLWNEELIQCLKTF